MSRSASGGEGGVGRAGGASRAGRVGGGARSTLGTTAVPTATQLQALHRAARAARPYAYAPYSKFLVGAALLDERGRVHAGCNVENAAYPQGVCAEASALSALVLAGGRRVHAAAVVALSPLLTTPCGGCRQKLAEFAGPDCPVDVLGPRGVRRRLLLGELLPHGFGQGHLPDGAPPTRGRS